VVQVEGIKYLTIINLLVSFLLSAFGQDLALQIPIIIPFLITSPDDWTTRRTNLTLHLSAFCFQLPQLLIYI